MTREAHIICLLCAFLGSEDEVVDKEQRSLLLWSLHSPEEVDENQAIVI